MRGLRPALIGAGIAGALMAAASTAPAQAVSSPAAATHVSPARALLWIPSTGGWIKTCKESTCSKVVYAANRDQLWGIRYENNRFGNRWYQVVTVAGDRGWIWCGNTEAPCHD
ncbi:MULTISPECIES: hypothetical protein [Streptomyces]|uniref:hypothetical protein n=1 Tax=Streptomyces TaxID=1883 RepID=UPI001315F0A9|nr:MULTISPECIES: hypothetical protein [Streptomyces]QGZ49057.1 hypothetical protein GPZ77_12300 [Streptomyces sp. QHH-9511]GGT91910.1 hypothetical protein GCM10010272_41000 [Streptomyces lateritius]